MNLRTTGTMSSAGIFFGDVAHVQKLFDLARDKSASSRIELSSEIGSMLSVDVSVRESELIADVLIDLMRQAEIDLRIAIAEKLSTIENVPLRLVLQLTNDDIRVAEPVLRSSDALCEFDLMYIIKSRTAEYWRVIAQRKNLTDQVVGALVDTGDFDTALNLVENDGIILNEGALVALSNLAQGHDTLALPLLRRKEVERDLALALYAHVGQQVKEFITQHFNDGDAPADVQDAVDAVIEEFEGTSFNGGAVSDDDLYSTARAAKERGLLNLTSLMGALRRKQSRFFAIQLSVHTELPLKKIEQALNQPSGQLLALIAKGYGFQKQDFVSLYTLIVPMFNDGEVTGTDGVKKAMAYYDKASCELSRQILNS